MERLYFLNFSQKNIDARVVFASESITDVLGYTLEEVLNVSCFDFFHPDELPFARKIHGRGVHLDKAAMLAYCQVKHKEGHFVTCETIFSVVYDVFVAATSVYTNTSQSQGWFNSVFTYYDILCMLLRLYILFYIYMLTL